MRNGKSPDKKMGRKLCASEILEARWCPASSLGWDGPGQGTAELTYFIGTAPSSMSQQQVESTLTKALSVWSDVADIQFTRTTTSGLRDSLDFTFRNLDGSGGTLAQAYFPDDVNPARIAGDVQFDSSERWEVGNGRGNSAFDLLWVAVHEIGHALGLDHISSQNSVMASTVSPSSSFVALSNVDRQSILSIYASADNDTGTTTTNNGSTTNTNQNYFATNFFANRWGWWWRSGFYRGGLASDTLEASSHSQHNADLPEDVDANGSVTPLDALTVINTITRIANENGVDEAQCDVNNDGDVSPVDALRVINRLSRPSESTDTLPSDSTIANSFTDDMDTDQASDPSGINDLLRLSIFVGKLANDPGCLDEDEDGLISRVEVTESLWDKLSSSDTDGDALLSSDELTTHRIQLIDEYFSATDENADGFLASDEVSDCAWRLFQMADSDGSETISRDELVALSPAFQGGLGRHRHRH